LSKKREAVGSLTLGSRAEVEALARALAKRGMRRIAHCDDDNDGPVTVRLDGAEANRLALVLAASASAFKRAR
jgi:hypothetical protein